MYIPQAFRELDLTKLHDLIEQYSFGTLISQVDSVPFATHLPFLLDRTAGANGNLIGHTARANPQCLNAGDQSVLAIFSGPHTYISPTWYESDNVVPTWNYIAVHVVGRIHLIEDAPSLLDIVQRTTNYYERNMPKPWSFAGGTPFSEKMLSQIIGFHIEIETIEGKWKLNQNHPIERQRKVIDALENRSDENSHAVAELMQTNVAALMAARTQS